VVCLGAPWIAAVRCNYLNVESVIVSSVRSCCRA